MLSNHNLYNFYNGEGKPTTNLTINKHYNVITVDYFAIAGGVKQFRLVINDNEQECWYSSDYFDSLETYTRKNRIRKIE